MDKPHRVRKKKNAPTGSTRSKGDFVEEVIANMHETPGVKVDRNIFLPAQDGGRTREIDVLLTSQVANYPVHIAIECKNEKKSVGIEEIDEFIGKLQDVNIPVQHGIFVSASGYTSGAAKRARKAGLKPLVLRDITKQFPDVVQQAFQSIVYLLASVSRFQIVNNIKHVERSSEILQFRDVDGNLVGSIADLAWDAWRSGNIPEIIGTHEIKLTLPDGWHQVIAGQVAKVESISVTVKVVGCVITLTGKVSHMSLIDLVERKTERNQIKATFEEPSEPVPVQNLSSEEDLKEFLKLRKGMVLTLGRIRIPRIVWEGIYWPPSKESMKKITTLLEEYQKGNIPDPRPFKISEIEGDDLSQAWAPVWTENPFLHRADKDNQ